MGRYDVMLLPHDKTALGVIIVFKMAPNPDKLDQALDKALTQIQAKNYAAELKENQVHQHVEIAVAVHGKKVAVRGRHTG